MPPHASIHFYCHKTIFYSNSFTLSEFNLQINALPYRLSACFFVSLPEWFSYFPLHFCVLVLHFCPCPEKDVTLPGAKYLKNPLTDQTVHHTDICCHMPFALAFRHFISLPSTLSLKVDLRKVRYNSHYYTTLHTHPSNKVLKIKKKFPQINYKLSFNLIKFIV